MRRFRFYLCFVVASVPGPRAKRCARGGETGRSSRFPLWPVSEQRVIDTRVEVVKQLIAIGGKDTIDPLIRATRDADPEVQIRATDGLVNYYLPGYIKQGLGLLVRVGASSKQDSATTTIRLSILL